MNCSSDALARRLHALDNPVPLDPHDPRLHQKLICWLEDAHVRRLPVAARRPLLAASFRPALDAYLRALRAPPAAPDLQPTVAWLVDLALALRFADAAPLYNAPRDPWHGRCVPLVPGAAAHPAVAATVARLAAALDMPPPPSALDGMRAVARAARVVDRMCVHDDRRVDHVPLGFATGDPDVDRVAKLMRVLYVARLRELQDHVNELVAAMQRVTAHPKTNAKLGKVGR